MFEGYVCSAVKGTISDLSIIEMPTLFFATDFSTDVYYIIATADMLHIFLCIKT